MRATWLLAIALVCLVASPCAAIWSHDPSENNPLCIDPAEQGEPAIAPDGSGGGIVVWTDTRGTYDQLYGQYIIGFGQTMWQLDGIPVCLNSSYHWHPKAVSDGVGGAIVTWLDSRHGEWRVYAERVDGGGGSVWDAFGVAVCTDTFRQVNERIVSDGQQGAIIVWEDTRQAEYEWDVYAQRIEGSGLPVWAPDGVGVCTAAGHQGIHGICEDGQGGVIVAWRDDSAGQDSSDIYVQRVSSAGALMWWPATGVAVCTAPGRQVYGGVASDGAGGCVVVWQDQRTGGYDIYAQRVDSGGYTRWAEDGIPVAATAEGEYWPQAVGDGAGGAVVVWKDDGADPSYNEIHAQRIDLYGQEVWTPGGVLVCDTPTYKGSFELVSDGLGGVIVGWEEGRLASGVDFYAQRFDSDGTPLWEADGTPVCTREDHQEELALVGDGSGGAVFAWRHGRRENYEGDIYAQRIERNGYLGYPCPYIVEVTDYPSDQGGMVVVSWVPSYLDALPYEVVTEYSVWRRMPWAARRAPPPEAPSTLEGPASMAAEGIEALARSGWSYVGSVPASYWTDYGYDAPTYADSTAGGGIQWTEYMVVAQTDDQWIFWESPSAVGYSVDNLAPGAPLALAAAPLQTDVELTWSPSGYHDEDLSAYNVYRSDVPGFVPDETTFINATVDTFLVDVEPGGGTWYYVVAGEDVHGNEGPPSNETSAETWTGVDDPVIPSTFALHGSRPNPFRSATNIAFDVPAAGGHVRIGVYDVSGRLVRVLVDGFESPGRKLVAWDGLDEAGGPAASGVYFYRMETETFEARRRMILLR